jgi:hypothetical protein
VELSRSLKKTMEIYNETNDIVRCHGTQFSPSPTATRHSQRFTRTRNTQHKINQINLPITPTIFNERSIVTATAFHQTYHQVHKVQGCVSYLKQVNQVEYPVDSRITCMIKTSNENVIGLFVINNKIPLRTKIDLTNLDQFTK